MKKMKVSGLIALALAGTLTFHSCIGSFNLTRNLYSWNNDVGDRFVNALVFFAFVIIPVYGVTLFLDGVILNTIEFWSGSNPVSMMEGEVEIQKVSQNGVTYEIMAVKNKFIATQIEGPQAGESVEFVFNPEEKSWKLVTKDFEKKLVQLNDNATVNLFYPEYTAVVPLDNEIMKAHN